MALNAESILRSLIGSLGIRQEDVAAIIARVVRASNHVDSLHADADVFKQGLGPALADMRARLERMEKLMERVEFLVNPNVERQHIALINGGAKDHCAVSVGGTESGA